MSAAESKAPSSSSSSEYRITTGPWASAWKIAAGVGVLGIAGALAGWASDARRFAFSYLFAFLFFLTVGLGSLIFVLLQHLTSAAWSVTVRRTAEFFMAALPVFALLFIPVYANMGHLFPWTHLDEFKREQPAGEHGAHGAQPAPDTHGSVAAPEHEAGPAGVDAAHPISRPVDAEQIEALEFKEPWYLNRAFFTVRALLYFAVWTFLSRKLFKLSTDQDSTKDPKLTRTAQSMAPAATFAFALSLTFAAFDWLMALNPMWFSTIFGVWIFAGSIVTVHAIVTLITLSFHSRKITGNAINVEHFHDLGKLTFGFLVFWAYISFAQFFLTWYASIPEETVFYHHRWGLDSPWKTVSIAIILIHFVLPFFLLLSRNTKRRLQFLWPPCVVIVLMHMIECYWIVLPNYGRNVFDTDADTLLAFHWMDAACFLGVGGIYLAVVFFLMGRYPLIPVGDPRLPRSLAFENA